MNLLALPSQPPYENFIHLPSFEPQDGKSASHGPVTSGNSQTFAGGQDLSHSSLVLCIIIYDIMIEIILTGHATKEFFFKPALLVFNNAKNIDLFQFLIIILIAIYL